MKKGCAVLGAGITGLACGFDQDAVLYEEKTAPGGICASYYRGAGKRECRRREDPETYRFEIGGGHWIFGADETLMRFIASLTPLKSYVRRASVYFPELRMYVPYPLQNHLSYIPADIRAKAMEEIKKTPECNPLTFADWLQVNFGKSLCEFFFFPFHDLYTAGLYTSIAPQDQFKSPVNKELILRGAREHTPEVGYNVSFVYPQRGLDDLIRRLAENVKISYGKKAVRVDLSAKKVFFSDDTSVAYEMLISTLPLDRMVEMAGCAFEECPAPHTSVAVFNIGARKGDRCPRDHWIYVPRSISGFHRVGFYSNVDSSFLPVSAALDDGKVSIYVERAFRSDRKPPDTELQRIGGEIVKELQEWGFIVDAEIVSPTWIEYAYTWTYPHSAWREQSIEYLKRNGVYQTGRYGKWQFQGISDSLRDGLSFHTR